MTMRLLRGVRRPDPPAPAEPVEWLPQIARLITRGKYPTVADPIVEPDWRGVRVLVHFSAARQATDATIRLVDDVGVDVTDLEPDVVTQLVTAVMAEDAVIDGVLTDQATRTGQGASIATTAVGGNTLGMAIRPRSIRADVLPIEGHDRDNLVAFVATDLLSVDGESLLDIPLLERKRVLDGLLVQSDLIRVSPYTRPPVEPWLATWKAAGFTGAVLKGANGRYRPSTIADDWYVVTTPDRR